MICFVFVILRDDRRLASCHGSNEYGTSLRVQKRMRWFNSQCNFLEQKFDGAKVSHPSVENDGSYSEMHVLILLLLLFNFGQPCHHSSVAIPDMEHFSLE
jgi:hypothetical protein